MSQEENKKKGVQDWSVEQVCEWLKRIGMEKYEQVFVSNEIRGKSLLELTENDLKEMEIKAIGHRREILSEIKELKRAGGREGHEASLNQVQASPIDNQARLAHQPHAIASPAPSSSPLAPAATRERSKQASSERPVEQVSRSSIEQHQDELLLSSGINSGRVARINSSQVQLTEVKLGQGAFKQVVAGVWNGKEVAVAKYIDDGSVERKKEMMMEEFKKEVEMRGRLQHDNLVNLLAFCCPKINDTSEPYLLVMDRMDKSLQELLDEKGKLSLEERVELMVDVAKAMDYLHNQEVFHRDLKPANVLVKMQVGEDGRGKWQAKISDFGISKQLTGDIKTLVQTAGVGTPMYLAPEMTSNEPAGRKSDVYSCAMSFFQILTGRFPYDNQNEWMQSMFDGSKRPKFGDGDGVPAEVQAVVVRMWQHDAANRPTFDQVLASLTDIQARLAQQQQAQAGGLAAASASQPAALRVKAVKRMEFGHLSSQTCRAIGSQGSNPGQLYYPMGILVDESTNHLIVSEWSNHRVQEVDEEGRHVRLFGNGQGNQPGQLHCPLGVTMSKEGRLIVCDNANKRLQEWRKEDASHAGLFAVDSWPYCVAIGPSGDQLFVSLDSHKIGVISMDGQPIGSMGHGQGSEDGQLNGPIGLAFNSHGDVLVGDSWNKRISVFEVRSGQCIATFSDHRFGRGYLHVAVDSFDRIIVSDSGSGRLALFEGGFESIGEFGSKGNQLGQFNCPAGVCVDEKNGRLLVCDGNNHRVQMVKDE